MRYHGAVTRGRDGAKGDGAGEGRPPVATHALPGGGRGHMCWTAALLLLLLPATAHSVITMGNPDAKRLYDDLLSNYNKLVRPVQNTTDPLTVRIKLKLSQLIDVVRNTGGSHQPHTSAGHQIIALCSYSRSYLATNYLLFSLTICLALGLLKENVLFYV